MTPYLQQRHAIANEPNSTLRMIGLSAGMVRKALGTPKRKSITERVDSIKLGWLKGSLATYEAILIKIEDGERMGPKSITELVDSMGMDAKDVTTSMYQVFGGCNPTLAQMREFVAAAKRRVGG